MKENIAFEISGVTGMFVSSTEVATNAPKNPVWRHAEEDLYIFNDGLGFGWKIGKKEWLTTGGFSFKSKL